MDDESKQLIGRLIDLLERQSAPPPEPVADMPSMQFGHTAARYNEQMAQIAADKQLAFLREQQQSFVLAMQTLHPRTD